MLNARPSFARLAPSRRQRGVSLIELMIGLALGLVVVGAMTTMYVESSKVRNQTERISRQVESGRYALQLITADLQQAGFYDAFDPDASSKSTYVAPPAAKPNPCDTGLNSLRAAFTVPVQGYNAPAANPLTCISDFKPNTDILVIRRASGCVAGPTADANCDAAAAGDFLFQASLCNTEINTGTSNAYRLDTTVANLDRHQRDCATLSGYRRLLVRIYYIANNNKPNDGVPTLKRAELGPGGFSVVPLVDGIQDLQIEYGIDLSPSSGTSPNIVLVGDGIPDAITADPDSYNGCSSTTHPSCTQYWQSVVTANVHLLARNIQINPGYTDAKAYTVGTVSDGPYNDGYERHVYQSLVRLYDADMRRHTQ